MVVLTLAPFSKIQTYNYWGRTFWEALQFRCCSPKPVVGNTLRWQVQAGGISLAFPANTCLDFSKRYRVWTKRFSIAGRQASPVLEKPGGDPSRRVAGDSPGHWLPVDTKGESQDLSPGGWGGSQREAFCSLKVLIFHAGMPGPVVPC